MTLMRMLRRMAKKSTALIVTLVATWVASCSGSGATLDGDAASDASTADVVVDATTSDAATDSPVLQDATFDAPNVPDAKPDAPNFPDAKPDALIAPDASKVCEAVGDYELESYFCDTLDITAGWKATISSTTAKVTSTANGTCAVKMTYQAAACTESENVEFGLGTAVVLSFKGIDSCQPASCKFGLTDDACVIGDRKVDKTGNVTLTIGGINRLKIESDLGDNVCVGPAKNIITLRQK